MGCGSWLDSCDSEEKPVHRVCVNSFYMAKYEVTQAQWQAIMDSNPSYFKNCDNCDNYPVENVSFYDANDFISRLNKQSNLKGIRLPTEAEWEYSCRSRGKEEMYCGGNKLDSLGWYYSNSRFNRHPVGLKKPNGLGLYDMSGNVWEWCQDWYSSDYYQSSIENNPIGPRHGSARVVRGGSWDYYVWNCRSAFRNMKEPGERIQYLGLRLALPLNP